MLSLSKELCCVVLGWWVPSLVPIYMSLFVFSVIGAANPSSGQVLTVLKQSFERLLVLANFFGERRFCIPGFANKVMETSLDGSP